MMPNLPMPKDLPCRITTTLLLISLVVLFLLGLPPGSAVAQEDTKTENPEQTVLQERTSADGASGRSAGTGDVKVGGGEAIAGDAYAGNGCAKAGDVIAGTCGQKAGGSQNGEDGGTSNDDGRPETDEDEITAQETTTEESSSRGTTLEETTLLEETTGDETTSSPSPAQEEGSLCSAGPPEDAVEAEIEGTADGDTLALAEEVEGHDTVRLIGVDTPELEGEDGQPEPFAEEASDFTAEELEGQTVMLQVGEKEADQYGRLLAHVWTSGATEDGFVGGLKRMIGMGEAELFNLKLLEKGYARVLTIEPNDLYAGCFEDAEAEARDVGVGLWAEDEETGGPTGDQYDEQTTRETTTEASPPQNTEPDTEPVQNTPVEQAPAENAPEETPEEASAAPEEGPAAEEPERQPSAAEAQYEQSPPSETEVQESVAPSGGDEAAVLRTGSSPGAGTEASASPATAGDLPVQAASTAPVSVLPETGGTSLLAVGAGLAAVGFLGGTMLGFLAVRSFLKRGVPGGR